MDALPAASSSERVDAPARQMTRSARRQAVVHVVDVFPYIDVGIVLKVGPALPEHLREVLHPVLAGGMNLVDFAG